MGSKSAYVSGKIEMLSQYLFMQPIIYPRIDQSNINTDQVSLYQLTPGAIFQ